MYHDFYLFIFVYCYLFAFLFLYAACVHVFLCVFVCVDLFVMHFFNNSFFCCCCCCLSCSFSVTWEIVVNFIGYLRRMAFSSGRSSSTDSSSSSLLYRLGEEGEAEALAPHFELTTIMHELEEPILSMDSQCDVMALLGEKGRLVVRDTVQDIKPLIAAIRNPYRVFLDPTGSHTLVAATDGEMCYFSSRQRKVSGHFLLQHRAGARDGAMTATSAPLLTTSNNVAECVCWLPVKKKKEPNFTTTKVHCLVGTKLGGFVFEVKIDVGGDGAVKASCRQCLQLPAGDFQSPLASIQVERVNSLWLIFFSTATRLYRAEGEASCPMDLIEKVAKEPELLHIRESSATSDVSARGAVVLYRPGVGMPAQSYAWTSTSGIVHGLMNRCIHHDLSKSEASIFGWSGATAVVNEQLLALTKVKQPTHDAGAFSSSSSHALPQTKMPMEVALTAFHMILLYNDRLVVLNHPAGLTWRGLSSTLHGDCPYACEIEERIRFDPFRATRKLPELRGIVRDTAARKIYIFGKNILWELQVEQEHRQQWWLFLYRAVNRNESLSLRKRFFQAAYNISKYRASSKNIVQLLRGKFFLQIGAIQYATDILADCDRFEDIYDLLVSLRNYKVLQLYVEKRYKLLSKYALDTPVMQTQLACLFALIVMQRLNGITRSEVSEKTSVEATASLNTFIEQNIKEKPAFFKRRSYNDLIARLLEGQGRLELALCFAERIKKAHYLLTYHVSHGNYIQAADVLSTLARRTETLELWYEFSPVLMKKCPIRLTTAMLRVGTRDSQGEAYMLLQLERLIPIFIQYSPEMNEDPSNREHQVIIFLERCITKFDCVSTVVHDYYLSLLAQHDGERLEEFLESSLFYSVDFALRRCLEARRYRQCVGLYRRLHLYEDAIRTALECSEPSHGTDEEWPALRVAKDVLRSLPNNMESSKVKKLWLIVAQSVLEKCNARMALSVVEDSGGILKLEDILGEISDSLVVQEFKDSICKSLDAYTSSIAALREQQLEASQISENIKQEIAQLQDRFGYITARQRCMLCHHLLLRGSAPYFIYPDCQHAVHEACAVSKLEEIGGLEAFLADEGLPRQFLEGVTSTSDLAQMECVLCGEASIIEIDIPLFVEDHSWSVE
ncbi:hypothetical protein MOQ_004102 [Trypanosoma cruzi marinkellei]|uniref:Pep3/Vps18 beta-propeller domain-containing protein n=1 Tax=Trypanosoma cruzi marinkellei TaxID=85056 RepID=K2MYB6_TRYCR|nr:hypothetical protein MOQ_004102 [Trypanosoma cruzi marinkellei]